MLSWGNITLVCARLHSFWQSLSNTNARPYRDTEHTKQILGRLILVRVVVLSLFLGASAWQLLSGIKNPAHLHSMFLVIGLTYAASLASAIWLKKSQRLSSFANIQLALDLLLATLVVYVTGGALSPFILLYLLVILGGAVLFGFEGALVIAALAGLSYAALAGQLVVPMDPTLPQASTLHILGVYVALVVLALVIGYFTRELDTAWKAVVTNVERINYLSKQQQQLFEEASEGIIALDSKFRICTINRSARYMLQLTDDYAKILEKEAFPVYELLKKFKVENSKDLIEQNATHGKAQELTLSIPDSQSTVELNFYIRPLAQTDQASISYVLYLNDLSHVKNIEKQLSMHERVAKLLAESETNPIPAKSDRSKIVGESQVMQQVLQLVDRIAESDASVLITGESGTGKELIARAIHFGGVRAKKPFIAINCGAIPENLIESELFGHKKGSFTGAISDNPGLFREAHGGTIFLDEVGELPMQMQTRLLRVLQEKLVRAVGDTRDIPTDVRIIAATNRNFKEEIAAKKFREDLFYRLNVVNVVVPPLRQRVEDIPLLVSHFIRKFSNPNLPIAQISPDALNLLLHYPFPGNIRELENIIERALVLGGTAILASHLPEELINYAHEHNGDLAQYASEATLDATLALPNDLENILAKIEIKYLEAALERSNGVKKRAAELLGLNFRSFRYRLKKYGMSVDDKDL